MSRRQAARHGSFGLPPVVIAIAAAVSLPLPAQPAATPGQAEGAFAITLDAGASQQGSRLKIQGTWPNACVPAFANASLSGKELTITARSTLSLCEVKATPLLLSIDPALALGIAALPGGIYHVWFRAAEGAQAAPKLRAFAVLNANADSRSAIVPETGFWWPVNGAGSVSRQVLSLEIQGMQLSAALLGYGADGRSNWQFGTSVFDGRVAHVPLLQLAGTEARAGETPGRRGEAGLVLDIEFQSNSHATAWLGSTQDSAFEVRAIDIVRLPFADVSDGAAWQGEWILIADDDSAPQRLRLRASAAAADNRFVLGDSHSGITVDCLYDPENSDLPAQNCTIVQRDGKVSARLDEIAMSRMDGRRADGVAVHLLRVAP